VNSAFYEGTVRHRRLGGVGETLTDEFQHRLFMAYLDLDELPDALEHGLLSSARRPALAWFRRSDHLGDPGLDLATSVRALVQERTGRRPEGPIRLLTQLRCWGHCFNPVSFYWCFAPDGERVDAVIAHVTNTPWGESHSYVLPVAAGADDGSTRVISGGFEKQLHVSPLMGMEHTYELRMSEPGERLSVHIESSATGAQAAPVFDATLSLARRELSAGELRGLLGRHPLPTVAVVARIYGHALRLRLKGATYHPHPTQEVPA
jgi:uncharacterized protein